MDITKKGWFALTPLAVFLCVYLISAIIAGDFYKVPISSSFLIAAIYAVSICKGMKLQERIETFSRGASNSNILIMIWIFILAGAFAATAKAIGAIDATVNLTLWVLPEKFLFAGLFLASCFISMAIGTSVGTVVALVPVAAGIAAETDLSIQFVTAIIVGGSFFGDNLSFISDTTIAATRSLDCKMNDKFKANLKIAVPAALAVTIWYVVKGVGIDFNPQIENINPLLLIPYISVIVMAIMGINVMIVLTAGILMNTVIGIASGALSWIGLLESVGDGIGGMGELIIVTMLAGGMLEIIRYKGGLEFIINILTRRINSKAGAEFSIAALVSVANLCTANNTIAIITTGGIAKDIAVKFNLDPRKCASILDTFSCLVQGIIPYGAQLLMAAGLAEISAVSIIGYLYYPFALGIVAVMAIIFRFK